MLLVRFFGLLLALYVGFCQKNARMETTILYGEWRSGKTRQEKRAAKRAKYRGIPLQIGEDGVPELFFYGVDSGIVGMKVADVSQTCRDSQNTSLCGYDKVITNWCADPEICFSWLLISWGDPMDKVGLLC